MRAAEAQLRDMNYELMAKFKNAQILKSAIKRLDNRSEEAKMKDQESQCTQGPPELPVIRLSNSLLCCVEAGQQENSEYHSRFIQRLLS